MSKIKNFEEFLLEEVYVRPNEPVQTAQPVQDQALQPQQTQPQVQPQTQQPQSQQEKKPEFDSVKANKKLDFVYLDKDANFEKIKSICDSIKLPENLRFIYGIIINPQFVSETKKYLEDGDVKIIAAISYPTGEEKNSEKKKLIQRAISEGADEVNVVMDYTKLINAMSETDEEKRENIIQNLQTDIRELVEFCKEKSIIIKIVIEMEALIDEDKISKSVEICKNANVDFIMTSTGMYNKDSNYSFDNKIKHIEEIILPQIQGMDDININVSGGVNSKDRLAKCLENNKVQRVSTTMLPSVLLKK